MKKIILVTAIAGLVVLSGCTGGSSTAGLEDKVQDRAQEKATDNALGKVGLPGMKKEKTTQEKVVDVATGKTSVKDAATDVVVDKAADMAMKKVM